MTESSRSLSPIQQQIISNIAQLQQALLNSLPEMPTLLQQLHRQLKNDPEVVTLLSEEEIQAIVLGLQRQQGIVLAKEISVPKAATKAKLSKATMEDLGF